MNHKEAEIWREQQITSTNYRQKLVQAREKKGLTQTEAGNLMPFYIGASSYYDVEAFEGDLTMCYSLNEVLAICKVIDIHPRDLFCDRSFPVVSISETVDRIKKHCSEGNLTISQFGEIAGWSLEGCIDDPAKALDQWNTDCLMDVCRELGIEWRCVIEGL